MKVHTITGGDRDFLELRPETVEEAASIVFAAKSEFIAKDLVWLQITPSAPPFLALRVYLGVPRGTQLDLATRDAIDRTP